MLSRLIFHFIPSAIIKPIVIAALQVSARYAMETTLVILALLTAAKRTLLQPTFDLLDFGFSKFQFTHSRLL
jgi:hypothetical protein